MDSNVLLKIFKNINKLFVLLILFSVSSISYAQEYTGRLSMHWNDKHHCTKHAQMFVDEVFEKSNGRLKIEVFHSGQLFGIREIMGGITSGAVDLGGVVGVVGFPKINKNFNVATIPGLFASFEQQREFFREISFGMAVQGSYHEIANFIDSVGQLDRIVTVNNLSMGTPTHENQKIVLLSTFDIKTYSYQQ